MRIDLPALRKAYATLRKHQSLLEASATDLHVDSGVIRAAIAAIGHVTEAEFRDNGNARRVVMYSQLEINAIAFASRCHNGQVRKYTGEPYINHPGAVADIVRSVHHDDEMLAASWLHDTVEDCGVSIADISRRFGVYVAALVESLTDVSKPEDGNRATRKRIDREHIGESACAQAMTIKLADLIDNSSSILAHDPEFAKVYLEEKRLLLGVLKQGDATLWARANDIVTRGQAK